MKHRTLQIKLIAIFATVLLSLAIHSTATGQATGSAATSPAIRAADDCDSRLKVALERLDKTLDAYEKATAALNAATGEIAARQKLDELKNQLLAVKDLIIAEQDKLIARLQGNKNSLMSKLKKLLDVAEKIALVGLGVWLAK